MTLERLLFDQAAAENRHFKMRNKSYWKAVGGHLQKAALAKKPAANQNRPGRRLLPQYVAAHEEVHTKRIDGPMNSASQEPLLKYRRGQNAREAITKRTTVKAKRDAKTWQPTMEVRRAKPGRSQEPFRNRRPSSRNRASAHSLPSGDRAGTHSLPGGDQAGVHGLSGGDRTNAQG